MAGTRLLIQLTFVFEFVLLICVAAYFGLCRNKDVLCTPLTKLTRQDGRSQLVIPPQWESGVIEIQTEIANEKDLQQTQPLQRYSMHITLVLEDGSDWSAWADKLDTALRNEFAGHPCLYKPIQTEISLQGNISKDSRAVIKDDNSTEFHVSSNQVQEWLERRRRRRHDPLALDVLIYVPVQTPLLVTMDEKKPTSALLWKQTLLTIVEQGDASLQRAMMYVDGHLQQKCQLSLFPNGSSWWWQQLVHDTHERAKMQVVLTRAILQKSSWKVAITNEVAQRWTYSMKLVDLGLNHAKQGDYVSAVEHMEQSLAESQSLQTDPALMTPLDLSPEHYMAIFAPLLFPLLLPFLTALVRETKRYRKLQKR
jgi:hypothetical protein